MSESPQSSQSFGPLEGLSKVNGELRAQLRSLQEKLDEADATIEAIRLGEVDAFVMAQTRQLQVFKVHHAERHYLQLAQEVANVGTWDFDPDQKVLLTSEKMRAILAAPGSSPIEARDLWNCVHPLDLDRVRELVVQTRQASGGEFSAQFRLNHAGERVRWISIRGSLIRGISGEVERFIGIGIDITEQFLMQESLREADRRKDEFLAVLAHELRNPLFPILAAAELLRLEPHNAAQVSELATGILRQSGQLQRLIDDLLDVARINTGKLKVNLTPLLLQNVVDSAIETSRPQINMAGVSLSVNLTEERLAVNGDAVRLTQVIANMLTNAAKFTPNGGRVEVMVFAQSCSAVIAIRDSGIGIPPDDLEAIFGLFSQVDSSNTREQGGLGIGLTLARNLIELHGGTIIASSPGRNLGSEFTIRLPLIEGEFQPTSSDVLDLATSTLPAYRCLLVDDNRASRTLVGRLLEKLGQEVRVAADVKSALLSIPEFRPQVIISDIAMPGQSGHDLARQVRSQQLHPRPTMIALTGYAQDADRAAALTAGFDQHLQKPISFEGLRTLLSRLVEPLA